MSKNKNGRDIWKDIKKTLGTTTHEVSKVLGGYLKPLKTEFTKGMILPLKTLATQELTAKRKVSENSLQYAHFQ